MSLRRTKGWSLFRSWIVVICLLVGAGSEANAFTAIVAVWTPREVFIGADSKATVRRGRVAVGAPSCKIHQMDSFLFAAAGHVVGIKQSTVAFDVFNLARQAAAAEGGLRDKADSFVRLVVTAVTGEVEAVRENGPQGKGRQSEGRVLLSSLLAGVENDAPILVVIHFVVGKAESGSGRIVPHVKVYGGAQQAPVGRGAHAAVFLGSQEEIRRRAGQYPNWWRPNISDGIRALIQAEADHNPQYVGGPVDLVSVDRDGAQWIERKAQCPAIAPPLAR